MVRGTFVVAALLLAGLASASALDFSDLPAEVMDFVKDKDWGSSLDDSYHSSVGRDDEEFFLLKKLHVWPRLSCEFASKMLELKDEMQSIDGLKHFQVARSLSDNHVWVVCEAWDSKEAFVKYIKDEGTKGHELCDYINSKDIRVELAPVKPIAEARGKASNHGRNQPGRALSIDSKYASMWTGGQSSDPECGTVWAAKFFIKPSELADFKKDLTEYIQAAQDESELVILKAAKVDLDDVSIVAYAEFASREGLSSHKEKPYTKKFMDSVLQTNVVAMKAPLRIITRSDTE